MLHLWGDLLEAPAHCVLAHCISADLKMGAGVALTIQERYQQRQDIMERPHEVGSAVWTARGRRVVHLVTKDHFRDQPDLASLELCLHNLREELLARCCYHLAIPEIGCGRDGLCLPDVLHLVREMLECDGIVVTMYHWRPRWERRQPQGQHLCIGYIKYLSMNSLSTFPLLPPFMKFQFKLPVFSRQIDF